MARHGENIFKRKDGRWEARYQARSGTDGRVVYRSVYGKTYKEAKEKRSRLLEKTAELLPEKMICFGDVLTMWLQDNQVHLKQQSCQKYRFCIEQHIRPAFGHVALENIDATKINLFLYEKLSFGRLDGGGGLSKNYVRIMSIIINSALAYAAAEGYGIPLKRHIYKPGSERKRIAVLTVSEQKRLESTISGNLSGGNLAVYLSLHTGLRLGEVCALRWANVDFQEQLIHVVGTVIRLDSANGVQLQIDSPKTASSERSIPLTTAVAAVLERERTQSQSEFVITGRAPDTFMNPRTLEYQFHAVLRQSELPPVPFHTLRHTFATRCISYGMDMKSLSEILGHSSVSITLNTYIHPSDELKRSGMERADEI